MRLIFWEVRIKDTQKGRQILYDVYRKWGNSKNYKKSNLQLFSQKE
jgi:hypothetical protein